MGLLNDSKIIGTRFGGGPDLNLGLGAPNEEESQKVAKKSQEVAKSRAKFP